MLSTTNLKQKIAVDRIGLIILLLIFICNSMYAQNISGKVYNGKNNLPVAYVNVGISGKNIGTVSDFNGKYSLEIDSKYDNDSLLFSSIGFIPFSINIKDLKKDGSKSIFLQEKIYDIKEVVIMPKEFKQKTLGVTTNSKMVSAGFVDNLLGYECGILLKVKKTAILKRVNLNISQCTYDTIFYRLNIYRVNEKTEFENILSKPIYIHLSKDQVKEKISIDLSAYEIVVDGKFLISLEHVKDLGPGTLNFCAGISNTTYYRKTSQASWETVPIGISISVEADVEK